MVLRFFVFAAAVIFFGCSSMERDNPIDQNGDNSSLKKCEDRFNSATHFCYDGVIYALCNGMDYNPTAYYCDSPVVKAAKCGNKEYNPLIERCLNNVIETKCGTNWYDSTKINLRCENDVVETKCGNDWYDTTDTNLRCISNFIEMKCENDWYDAKRQRCQNNIVETKCGNGDNYHNPETQFCNWNSVVNKCGGEVYEPATEFCSKNSVYSLCNGKTFQPIMTVCGDPCREELYQRCENGVVETKCRDDWYDTTNTNLRCLNNILETKCGNDWYDTTNTNLRCENNVIQAKCGSGWYNTYSQYCSDDNIINKGEFTDDRDGKTYKYVIIGEQTWMAENLNYNVEGSKCYNDSIANCNKYGMLYDWSTAMTFESSCNSNSCSSLIETPHQGICPDGWHIPSYTEWTTLIDYAGGTSTAGTKLKATMYWRRYSDVPVGTDIYGFAALPGGYGNSDGYFYNVGNDGYWWSASEGNASNAYYRRMNYKYEYAYWNDNYKTVLFSVRCIQD